MRPIRVLVADDHLFYREGIRTLLKHVAEVEVVGEAESGDAALSQATALQPDVILMDIKMPQLNGIEATRAILKELPEVAILVVTMFDDDESLFAAMRAGARGYLLKDADQEELVQAIQAVSRGQAIFSPAIAQRLIRYFGGLSTSAQPAETSPFPELTEREREVLELIARGDNNSEIAHRLTISIKTVQNHVSNILSKLHVADRAQAIVKARKAGLG